MSGINQISNPKKTKQAGNFFLSEILDVTKTIKLSEELVLDAHTHGKQHGRTAAKQIEYWAKIGKVVIENPDLPYSFIEGTLSEINELKAGLVSDYDFG